MNTITTYPHRREGARLLKIVFWIGMVALFLLLGRVAPVADASVRGSTLPPMLTVLVGPINDIGDTIWVVAGVEVEITDDTRINERMNSAHSERWARVEGVPNGNGGLVAERIKVLPPLPFIRIVGVLDSLSGESLLVSGILVGRDDSTLIVGAVTQGARVGVKASFDGEDLLALQVHPMGAPQDDDDDAEIPDADKLELIGQVIEGPDGGVIGPWDISTIPVSVTDNTEIKQPFGALIPGDWVKIEGQATGDGGILALEMKTTETRDYHKLEGVLDELSDSEVVVNGIRIALDPNVQIEGTPTVGQRVEIRARLDNETLYAIHIEGEKAENQGDRRQFVSAIRALPAEGDTGEWQIGNYTVEVTEATVIDQHKGSIQVGAQVRVEVLKTGEDLWVALSIVVLNSGNSGHKHFVEFKGTVTSLPEDSLRGDWTVSERTVLVTERTVIKGNASQIEAGVTVEIKGYERADGVIEAQKIEIESEGDKGDRVEFEGEIQQLPPQDLKGIWVVAGREVKVTPQTRVEGDVAVGVTVKVEGRQSKQGPVHAEKIEVIDHDD
jgi:hypothetical protein